MEYAKSPTILSIVNLFITTGTFSSTLKSSIISPLLKNLSLNKEDLSNYRPIANLSLISKLIEKIVKKRLLDYLTSNPFNLPIPNSTLPRLHYFPYMTVFLMPSPCNKSPVFVFLIYHLLCNAPLVTGWR